LTVDPKDVDFAKADDDTLALILNEGDKRLAAQVALMLSADTRANAILAGSVGLAAAGFAIAAGTIDKSGQGPLFAAALVFALMATVSAIAAVMALWPTGIAPQGWNPTLFGDDIAAGATPHAMRVEMCRQIAKRIGINRSCAATLTRRIRVSMILLAASPFAGGVAATVTVFWPHCGA
jgi:hypothetical protein